MKFAAGITLVVSLALPFLVSGSIINLNSAANAFDSVLRFVKGREHDVIKNKQVVSASRLSAHPFCNKLDCPDYKVLKNESTYELREYVATQWVSTALKGIAFDTAENQMFHKLFDYISGQNKDKKKIAMTAPVRVRIIPGPGPACESDFIMSFFVSPKEGQAPAPTDATVSLTSTASIRVYVRSFGGFASESKWVEEAAQLAKDLGDSVAYEKDYYYTAGYDSPFKFLHRHNEVWFVAQ